MTTLIIAFLIAIGVITSPEGYDNMTEEEKSYYMNEIISDDIIDLFTDDENDSEGN